MGAPQMFLAPGLALPKTATAHMPEGNHILHLTLDSLCSQWGNLLSTGEQMQELSWPVKPGI